MQLPVLHPSEVARCKEVEEAPETEAEWSLHPAYDDDEYESETESIKDPQRIFDYKHYQATDTEEDSAPQPYLNDNFKSKENKYLEGPVEMDWSPLEDGDDSDAWEGKEEEYVAHSA